jgi:uncharacterized DUF497 family protein
MLEFEWDPDKADANYKKHQVDFTEATSIFGDLLSITVYDPDHSDEEDRYLTMGMSVAGRVLIVSHTNRGDRVRIISARAAARRERKAYEEGQEN